MSLCQHYIKQEYNYKISLAVVTADYSQMHPCEHEYINITPFPPRPLFHSLSIYQVASDQERLLVLWHIKSNRSLTTFSVRFCQKPKVLVLHKLHNYYDDKI